MSNTVAAYITLYQLQTELKEFFALSFEDTFWLLAEIADLKQAASGHIYMDLVEKQGNNIVAKTQAVVWYDKWLFMRQKFGNDIVHLLKKGNKVLLRVQIDFHQVYGLKLVVSDLDQSVTLGELELRRQETLLRLKSEQLIGKNRQLPLPSVPQRVAVISAKTAAGYGDFVNHIQHNPYGYCIKHTLFQSTMQGDNTSNELIAQLKKIEQLKSQFDLLIIIRGGGSKLDLECFNDYTIAAAVAHFPLPVFTGIGHQQDETLIDLTAHTPFKTPTAVADFLIQCFADFEVRLLQASSRLQQQAQQLIAQQKLLLQRYTDYLRQDSQNLIEKKQQELNDYEKKLRQIPRRYLQAEQQRIDSLQRMVAFFDPQRLLRYGYVLVRNEESQIVRSAAQIKPNDQLHITFADGTVQVEVNGITTEKNAD